MSMSNSPPASAQRAWWQAQTSAETVLVLAFLIIASVLGRLWLDQPNFKPSLAAAILAGAILRDWRLAVAVPFASLALTDGFLGVYEWPLMVAVYACLMLPVFWTRLTDSGTQWLSQRLGAGRSVAIRSLLELIRLNVGAAVSAVLFFAVTSWVVWTSTPWYSADWAGLSQAYLNALPFLRWMLQGNVVFLHGLLVVWIGYRAAACAVGANDVRPALPQ